MADVYNLSLSNYTLLGHNSSPADFERTFNWGVLALTPLIAASALGNVLVCLAVCWERRLQNMTNYFLMSLAIADLLVSLLVMPIGMVVELFGYFPLQQSFCVLWATVDVLLCTASIWHMCTMSMDRFCTLKYPMKYGRNKTKTMVALKITFVWITSIAICCPLCIMGFLDYNNVFIDGQCIPTIRDFVIYGSIFAFYVPLLIMVITYGLTIQILCNNQKIMRSIVREHRNHVTERSNRSAGATAGKKCGKAAYLSPFMPRFVERTSVDNSISLNASASYMQSTSESCMPKDNNTTADTLEDGCSLHENEDDSCSNLDQAIPIVTAPSDNSIEMNIDQSVNSIGLCGIRSSKLSVSQPHLPSMSSSKLPHISPSTSQHSLRNMPRAISQLGVQDLESVQNFEFVSAATSLNSMLSREQFGSCSLWSEFEDPEMFEKLSQIEAEMDECLKSSTTEPPVNDEFFDCEVTEATSLLSVFLDDKGEDNASQCINNNAAENCSLTNNKNGLIPQLSDRPSTSSTSSTEKDSSTSDHEQSKFVTIRLKPSGCYLYRINSNSHPKALPSGGQYALVKTTDSEETPSHQSPESISAEQETIPETTSNGRIHNGLLSPPIEYPTRIAITSQSDKVYSASAWKAFLHRKRRLKLRNHRKGEMPQIISKRTASNERKASKVLGIIFAVFIILWTPFFIMNILSVACVDCMKALTPPMTASIVWLGYLSSLANPIIYTMFNTAFRHSFYKILTCSYTAKTRYHHTLSPHKPGIRRHRTPESLYMTNMTSNCQYTSSETRRNTVITVTLNKD